MSLQKQISLQLSLSHGENQDKFKLLQQIQDGFDDLRKRRRVHASMHLKELVFDACANYDVSQAYMSKLIGKPESSISEWIQKIRKMKSLQSKTEGLVKTEESNPNVFNKSEDNFIKNEDQQQYGNDFETEYVKTEDSSKPKLEVKFKLKHIPFYIFVLFVFVIVCHFNSEFNHSLGVSLIWSYVLAGASELILFVVGIVNISSNLINLRKAVQFLIAISIIGNISIKTLNRLYEIYHEVDPDFIQLEIKRLSSKITFIENNIDGVDARIKLSQKRVKELLEINYKTKAENINESIRKDEEYRDELEVKEEVARNKLKKIYSQTRLSLMSPHILKLIQSIAFVIALWFLSAVTKSFLYNRKISYG